MDCDLDQWDCVKVRVLGKCGNVRRRCVVVFVVGKKEGR